MIWMSIDDILWLNVIWNEIPFLELLLRKNEHKIKTTKSIVEIRQGVNIYFAMSIDITLMTFHKYSIYRWFILNSVNFNLRSVIKTNQKLSNGKFSNPQKKKTIYHTPHTIHHIPYTIYHTPYTIHHTPNTIHNISYTIHHTPYTIHHILHL